MTPVHTTRLAPSPTGALHLGNARTFLINWALARQRRWRVLLRIDDLDGPRTKSGAAELAIKDLQWLGLDWDEPPSFQRQNLTPYAAAIQDLVNRDYTYPCVCTRSEIASAQSAPHEEDHELRYPGTCRPDRGGPHHEPANSSHAIRLIVPDEPIEFRDRFAGCQCIDVQRQVGDFVISTKAGLPSYQLAVVVDDARHNVSQVVRGDDLLRSTARQILLYERLALGPPPHYWHLPLVIGPDGRRLAKRHGDTRVAFYREHAIPASRIVGLMAHWCGVTDRLTELEIDEFKSAFSIDRLPKQDIMFDQEAHGWLMDGAN